MPNLLPSAPSSDIERKKELTSIEDIFATVLKRLPVTSTESVPIAEAAGRVISKNVKASVPDPARDNSGMDGYAIRAACTARASEDYPVRLKVISKLPAGSAPEGSVRKGEAVRVKTGALIPNGADAVVALEDTEEINGYVLIGARIPAGQHIRKKGGDFKVGSLVLRKGSVIGAPEVAMLALVGSGSAYVFKKPRVAIISIGGELCGHGRIPDCSSPAIAAAVLQCGGLPLTLGPVKDNRNSIRKALEKGLCQADCIVTSGGVSAGDYGLTGKAVGELGGAFVPWRVRMKPGKPFAFGRINGKPLFGLPGNPVSAIMSFETLVMPALFRMSGRKDIFREFLYAELTSDISHKPGRRFFMRAVLIREGNRLKAAPLPRQGSGMLKGLTDSNSIIIVPEGAARISKGTLVKVIVLNKFLFKSAAES